MKAYTKLELKADMAVIYKKAYGYTMDYLKDKEDAGDSIEWEDIPETNVYKGSKKEKITGGTSYTEALKDSLEAAYVEDKTKYDSKFFEEWEKLKGFLEEEISKEKYFTSDDESLSEIPAWMDDLATKVGQTYSINKATPVDFDTKFRYYVKKVYNTVFKEEINFDQIALKITDKKKGISKFYGSQYISTDCLYKAISSSSEAECK